jgi:hypothetical protein
MLVIQLYPHLFRQSTIVGRARRSRVPVTLNLSVVVTLSPVSPVMCLNAPVRLGGGAGDLGVPVGAVTDVHATEVMAKVKVTVGLVSGIPSPWLCLVVMAVVVGVSPWPEVSLGKLDSLVISRVAFAV